LVKGNHEELPADTKGKWKKEWISMEEKDGKSSLFMVGFIIVILLGVVAYTKYTENREKYQQEQEALRNQEYAKKSIMLSLGFGDYIDDEGKLYEGHAYEEGFLKDGNLSEFLLRFNEYMISNYPYIEDDREYKEITIERLKTKYEDVAYEIEWMRSTIKGEEIKFEAITEEVKDYMLEAGTWTNGESGRVNEAGQALMSLDDIAAAGAAVMRECGDWSGGVERVDKDSDIALKRQAKAGCMKFLYIGKYKSEYIFNGYEEKVYDTFLADGNLPQFIAYMKNYLDESHSDIGYSTKYEEITVERLKDDYENVYEELRKIVEAVEEAGVEWMDVRLNIADEMGISDKF